MFAEILGPELLVVLLVVALLFGSARLPKLARGLGAARREFEAGVTGEPEDGDDPNDRVEVPKAEYDELVARARARRPPAAASPEADAPAP